MTVIEIKPHRWGWQVFEAPGEFQLSLCNESTKSRRRPRRHNFSKPTEILASVSIAAQRTLGFSSETRFDPWCNHSRDRHANCRL
jgi:hypothetical protein